MLRSGGAKSSLLTLPCQTLAFRAINISPEQTGRGERPEGRRGTKQPEGFNRFNLLKASGVAVTINDRDTTESLYIHASTRKSTRKQKCDSQVRAPLPKNATHPTVRYCGALAQQNAKNGSIKMTAPSTHSPRKNKIEDGNTPVQLSVS